MPPLSNAKHELFAQALAKGKTQEEAYVAAGYKADRGAASRLSTNVSVQARRSELLSRAAIKAIVTIDDIAAQLDEDRKLARELGHPAAAVSATMGKAKVLGLIVDKSLTATTSVEDLLDQLPSESVGSPSATAH